MTENISYNNERCRHFFVSTFLFILYLKVLKYIYRANEKKIATEVQSISISNIILHQLYSIFGVTNGMF